MKKQNLYWLCQILAWSLYGILEIILYSSANTLDASKIVGEFFIVGFYIISTHALREIIIRARVIQFRWFQVLPRVFLLILLFAFANYFFLLGVSYLTDTLDFNRDLSLVSLIVNVVISMILYFIWTLAYMSFLYIERFNKSLQHQAIAREVELSNLKSQLNPHFIFNALNSIRALVDENPRRSKDAITQLSNILRNSLRSDSHKLIPFDQEMTTVNDYLSLESIRYEERLKTKYNIHPDSNRFQIPPLMIQTLVENGIKHGIASLKEGGTISITTDVVENTLKLDIRNSGQYKNGVKLNVGYGLLNTKKRLDLIYGNEADFKISNENENTVLTSIRIPENIYLNKEV